MFNQQRCPYYTLKAMVELVDAGQLCHPEYEEILDLLKKDIAGWNNTIYEIEIMYSTDDVEVRGARTRIIEYSREALLLYTKAVEILTPYASEQNKELREELKMLGLEVAFEGSQRIGRIAAEAEEAIVEEQVA